MKLLYYGYEKLIGAGFSFSLYAVMMLAGSSFDMFEVSETLASPLLWAIFYGYGIACSAVIDGLVKTWPVLQRWQVLLYLAAGFVIFIFLMEGMPYIIIAGLIGSAGALLFFFGIRYVGKIKWLSFIFAVLLPLVFLAVTVIDFTEKEDWEGQRHAADYEASFTYFNGEHKIPVELESNQSLTFHIDFNIETGGYGYHVEDDDGDHVPMHEVGGRSTLKDVEAGDYSIVIHGSDAKGRFTVEWEKETES